MDSVLKKITDFEKKNQRKALYISAAITVAFFILLWFWFAVMGFFPTSTKKEYVTIGFADFGTTEKGQGDVNNFLAPSDNPGDGPPGSAQVTAPSNPVQSQENVVTQTNPSPVAAPPASENPSSSETPAAISPTNDPRNGAGGNDPTAGSAHGTDGVKGDKGDPRSQVLGNGMDFVDGFDRRWISLPPPKYTVDQEAILTFELTIRPDGSVKFVKPPITSQMELKKAGMDAIYSWKFEPVDSDEDQKTKVTIKFRQK